MRFVLKNVSGVLEEFDIEFVKLRDGDHVFRYEPGVEFFEAFENTDVKRASIFVLATLEKSQHLIKVELELSGIVGTSCDRCLEVIDFPVQTEYELLFELQSENQRKVNEFNEYDDMELVVVPHYETTINFSRQVYESVLLSIPMLRNCDNLEEKKCDQEMLEKLSKLNHSAKGDSDPRWDKLKDLLK